MAQFLTSRSAKRGLWTLAVLAVAYLFVYTFVCRAYYVDSESMNPTIFGAPEGGEHVFVTFGRSSLERFEIVVVEMPGQTPLVKRVWGLPGESVRIRYGDLFIDDQRIGMGLNHSAAIEVFNERYHALDEHFVFGKAPWSRDGDEWIVDASEVPAGSNGALIYLQSPVNDDHIDRDGNIIRGARQVNDLIARCEVRFLDEPESPGLVRFGLREWGDTFEACLAPLSGGGAKAWIVRRNKDDAGLVLVERDDFELAVGRSYQVRFANVDNELVFEVGAGEEVQRIAHRYNANVFDRTDVRQLGKTPGHQFQLAAEGLRVALRDVVLERDLFFTSPEDSFGVEEPCELSLDEIFVLGDNSAQSRDSRELGGIALDRIVGRVRSVIWPLGAWRTLQTPAGP